MISYRQASMEDAKLIFDWSNDFDTRQNSFNSNPIVWENHLVWLETRLRNEDVMLIFEINGTAIGMVRFYLDQTEATIGVIVAPDQRGKNYGSQIIELGAQFFREKNPTTNIHAFIKNENIGSIKSFEKANFKFVKNLDINGTSSVEMLYSV